MTTRLEVLEKIANYQLSEFGNNTLSAKEMKQMAMEALGMPDGSEIDDKKYYYYSYVCYLSGSPIFSSGIQISDKGSFDYPSALKHLESDDEINFPTILGFQEITKEQLLNIREYNESRK